MDPLTNGRVDDFTMNNKDKEWLSDHFGKDVLFDEPMSRHTTFGIGGPADALLYVRGDEQIKDLARWANDRGHSVMILGAGSNLLVREGGIRGLVLRLVNGFRGIDEDVERGPGGYVTVQAGAGVLLRRLAKFALDRGLAGLNFGLGIPGTVGGALRMNAGAWGACMADTVRSVSVLTKAGDIATVGREALGFSCRTLDLEEGSIILRGVFQLQPVERESLQRDAIQMQKKRRATQPLSLPSAGCVFRNPPGQLSAGELIDKAGLKGFQKGAAEVSTRHGNFIVNKGHAKATDIIALMEHVKKVVFKQFGVTLDLEVVIVGQEAGS
ncbi:MAG: UDP-N-acetylmuramate dehydrogenase [Thermodesulfobacteriota bacterium]|nr:UDP-N-acetylmuramate dehydrogenase [Thermodesulfobacteriota bacterium]